MIAKSSSTVHLFKFLWLTENVKHFEAQMQMVRLHVFLQWIHYTKIHEISQLMIYIYIWNN